MSAMTGSAFRRSEGRRDQKLGKTVSPLQVYDFALRCAIRAWLEHTGNSTPAKKERSDRYSLHISRADMFGSLVERFRDENKNDKLTREFVRALLHRLDDIKKGRDTTADEYLDERFIRIVISVKKYVQQHRYRPTGSINDIVIYCVKTSEAQLKESNSKLADWHGDLTRFSARFADIIIKVLREDVPSSATPELLETLEKFLGTKPDRQSSNRLFSPDRPLSLHVETLESFSMIKTVEQLFQVDEKEHFRRLVKLQASCTVSALLVDLKKCIDNVYNNETFPGRYEDFPGQVAYDSWRNREIQQLKAFIKTLQLMHPDISSDSTSEVAFSSSTLLPRGSTSKRRSLSHITEVYEHSSVASDFTFIPNNPHSHFRLLMNMCIDYDTKVIPGSERVKSSVLSQQSDDLLRECWKTWRLSAPFRALLYLELIIDRFSNGDLKAEDINFATQSLEKVTKENGISNWTSYDNKLLIEVFQDLNNIFCQMLNEYLSEYWKISQEKVERLVWMMNRVRESAAYPRDQISIFDETENFQKTVERAAVNRWSILEQNAKIECGDELTNLLAIAESLKKELVSLAKSQLKLDIKGLPSISSIVMERQMPYIALEMENWAYLPENQEAPIEVIFELYHKVLSLKRLYIQYGPKQKAALFKVEYWFLSHVRRWLNMTDKKTSEWVENSLKQDEFTRLGDTSLHSSSIVDLFSMFHQAVDFVQNLQWPNEFQLCRFMTALSKIIATTLGRYTDIAEEMIKCEIDQPNTQSPDKTSYSLLDKARSQLSGSRLQTSSTKLGVLPVDFTPTLCVKINNIEAARAKLDRLYQIMDVDDIAETMRDNERTVEKINQTNFLYSIKVVRAENLQPLDHNGLSDPYVVLEVNNKQITRTRTCHETLNPRWDHVFDIWLGEKTVDVLAVVYDEDLIGANEECGGVWFKLSPDYFDDYQTHELTLNLHPQGKLILRISMEGEKDDIQFWFGKAFRTLKRAENDAAGLIVEKMRQYLCQCLSRKTLDKLLSKDKSLFSTFSRTQNHVEPSLQDCEDAIAPILDYLERNLKILNDNLSEANMRFVVLKIWKEIMLILEGILLPPLSERPSDTKPLDDYEFHVVFKWLELLKVLFNGGEDGDAIPIEKLESSQYYALLAINIAYNLETDELMDTFNTVAKNQLELQMRGGRKADRSRSIYRSKNTAREKKLERRSISIDLPSSDAILRILRMRQGKHVREFLQTEFAKRNNPPPPAPPLHIVSSASPSGPAPAVPSHAIIPAGEQALSE